MTTLKRLLALLTAAALCLALCACKDTTGEESGSPDSSADVSADPNASPAPSQEIVADLNQAMYEFSSGMDDDGTAMTVNGRTISNQMFFYWLSYYCYNTSYYAYLYGSSVDFSDKDVQTRMLESTREAVAYHAVLRDLCQEAGITITDEQSAELEGQINDTGLNTLLEEKGLSQEEISAALDAGLESALQDQGLTREQVHEAGLNTILRNLGVTEENFQYIAQTTYLFTNYAEHVMGEATAEKLEKYVEDQGIFAVKHILLSTVDKDVMNEDGTVAETKDEHNAAQKTRAEELLTQLQEAEDLETRFDELMMTYSDDNPQNNPDGYVFDSETSLVGGFREAALALEPGEISGVVETDYGYHIMLRLPVDASEYKDDWYTDGADDAIYAQLDKADVTVDDAIAALDVNDFYNRYMAYNTALYESLNPPASAAPETDGPVPEE